MTTPQEPAGRSDRRPKKIRVRHLLEAKQRGEHFSMLTSYDALTAGVFDEAGIEVLLVGDSVGTTVLGHESTVSTTHRDMLTFTGAVARGATRPLLVADLAFGSYETGPKDAVRHGVELVRAGAEAVKLEGGAGFAPQVRALVDAGIPVMGHLGFTPQSINTLSGHRVQGRGENAAQSLLADARALQEAGAFAVVLELVTDDAAAQVTAELEIPTVGIGAGVHCTGQVLVWQDMAGLSGFHGRFVKAFADLRSELGGAAAAYREEVRGGTYPGPEHSFE